tara:strand:+ start:426 stop:1070 length:645 start_codon:yes stop_codon:yes gene_type:complete
MKTQNLLLCGALAFALLLGCSKEEEPIVESSSTPPKYLYVSSGSCYSGSGNTAFTNATSSNLVYRVDLSTGQRNMILADYNASPSQPGDSPVGLVNIDSNQIYVVVENTTTAGARRIEKVSKSAFGTRSLFSNTTAALSAQLRGVEGLSNGDLLITKSTAIEKITSSNVRIVKGTSPFVNAPAAPCATSTTLISKTLTLNNGHIVYLHAATSQN